MAASANEGGREQRRLAVNNTKASARSAEASRPNTQQKPMATRRTNDRSTSQTLPFPVKAFTEALKRQSIVAKDYPVELSKTMFALDRSSLYEEEIIIRIQQMVQELSEQLTYNQKIVANLQSKAGSLKNQAVGKCTGSALKRFNVDLSRESFESEVERSNAQMLIENKALTHENRELSMLLKEYEQTLETVMSKIKNHAVAAQQHELKLTKHYETLIAASEANALNDESLSNAEVSATLGQLSQKLRLFIRSLAREEEAEPTEDIVEDERSLETLVEEVERIDWALDREAEIERLEKENEELRNFLKIDAESARAQGITDEDMQVFKLVIAPRSPFSHVNAHLPDGWGKSPPQQQQQLMEAPPGPPPVNMPGMNMPNKPPVMALMQKPMEIEPGMRPAGTVRRTSMFGQRGRGTGLPPWPVAQDRGLPWRDMQSHNDGPGGIDLAG